jgi:hypothetical protein
MPHLSRWVDVRGNDGALAPDRAKPSLVITYCYSFYPSLRRATGRKGVQIDRQNECPYLRASSPSEPVPKLIVNKSVL